MDAHELRAAADDARQDPEYLDEVRQVQEDLHGRVVVDRGRMDALMRWLLDEGHITPLGVRQIEAVLDAEAEG